MASRIPRIQVSISAHSVPTPLHARRRGRDVVVELKARAFEGEKSTAERGVLDIERSSVQKTGFGLTFRLSEYRSDPELSAAYLSSTVGDQLAEMVITMAESAEPSRIGSLKQIELIGDEAAELIRALTAGSVSRHPSSNQFVPDLP